MTNEIIFPITLDYVAHWEDNGWPILREIVANALDSDPGFRIGLQHGVFWVEDQGAGLAIRHLLFGVSEKNGANAVGQFGEGLKLALLALTRAGLTAHIYSGDRHLWNEPAEMEGEPVFKIAWEHLEPQQVFEGGTRVEIPNWPFKTFQERFIRPGDPRILFTDPFGRSILEEDPPGIYVKGVWVQKARSYGRSYTFGYNLTDVEMNRDRGVVDTWHVNAEIGKIWASVTDEDLLERFWQAVTDQMGEKHCNMHGCAITDKRGMKHAFQAVFGNNAVLQTDEAMGREAEYRGAKVVTESDVGGFGLKGIVKELVGTDAQHVAEMEGGDRMYLPDKKLPADKLKILRMLRRLAKRIGAKGKLFAYLLPDEVYGESYKDDIRISLARLADDEQAIATWLHEEGHRQYGTADATADHSTAIAKVAAKVIASYARRR